MQLTHTAETLMLAVASNDLLFYRTEIALERKIADFTIAIRFFAKKACKLLVDVVNIFARPEKLLWCAHCIIKSGI